MSSTQPGAILPRVLPPGTFLLGVVLPRITGRSDAARGGSASGSGLRSGRVGGACISGSSRLCQASTCTLLLLHPWTWPVSKGLCSWWGVWGCASVSPGFFSLFLHLANPPGAEHDGAGARRGPAPVRDANPPSPVPRGSREPFPPGCC